MIWEIFQFYTTPAPRYVKKMGFLEEAIGMSARRKRCAQEWGQHFFNCQKAIEKAASQTTQQRTILIFGAGSLRDIPLESLSNQFKTVLLVDIVFLKESHKRIEDYPNISLIERDITGSMAFVFYGQRTTTAFNEWLNVDNIDCVVSLNLITQLPLLPVSWLMKNFALSEKKAGEFGQIIIQQHLDYLKQFQGVVCLIADRLDIEFDADENIIDEFDPLWDVELPKAEKTWDWKVMPIGETNTKTGQKNRVGVSIWSGRKLNFLAKNS